MFQVFASFYLLIRYLIFLWHLSTVFYVPKLIQISHISCQTFLASLLSRWSCFSAHSSTRKTLFFVGPFVVTRFPFSFVVFVKALVRPLLLRRIDTGVTTGKSRHCCSLAQLHKNCEIDRRMVERSSVLQRLSAHRGDRHSLPLDLNSNCRDSSLQTFTRSL